MVGAVLALVGGFMLYAREELFEPRSVAARAQSALVDEGVRIAVSPTIVDAIAEVTPAGGPSRSEVARALADPRVNAAFGAASRKLANETLRRDPRALDLNLSEVAAIAVTRADQTDAALSPAELESATIELTGSGIVIGALESAEDARVLGLLLPALALLALIGSVLVAPDLLIGLTRASVALAVAAAFGFVVLSVGRELVVAQFDAGSTRDAVSAGWDALLGDLRTWTLAVGGAAAVVAIAAGLGSRREARYRA